MARKKQKWQVGDYFGIPIEDDFLAVGQILGKYDWIGVACLITKMKISSKNLPLYEDIKIDKNLDKFKGKVLFPKKLALAEELLQRAKFPTELKEKLNIS